MSRLTSIDFSGIQGAHRSPSWIQIGRNSALHPGEVDKILDDENLVEAVFATEDNLVLAYVSLPSSMLYTPRSNSHPQGPDPQLPAYQSFDFRIRVNRESDC